MVNSSDGFRVLWKCWHEVADTAYLPIGGKVPKGSPLTMKSGDSTSVKELEECL